MKTNPASRSEGDFTYVFSRTRIFFKGTKIISDGVNYLLMFTNVLFLYVLTIKVKHYGKIYVHEPLFAKQRS